MIAILSLAAIAINANAQTTTPSSTVTAFCSGASSGTGGATTGGIIPSTNILSGQSNGEQSIISVSVLIMLAMLMIVALIYMVSYAMGLPALMNFVKSEIAEIALTGIIIAIFIGAFTAASAATTTVHVAGVSIGQQTFVDDCTYLSDASLNLFLPYLYINLIQLAIDTIESLKISITPSYFGFETSPLNGLNLFDSVLGILENITGAFIVLILITIATLGFVYGFFPIFLYAGIILRTLPWTRAAGGAFLGLFVGFYIVFPLLLHVMLAGYAGTMTSPPAPNANAGSIQSIVQGVVSNGSAGGSAIMNNLVTFITAIAGFFGGQWGIINGYIYFVIEPAVFNVIAIVISFVIAFDFVEVVGDLLGAPSLSADRLISRINQI